MNLQTPDLSYVLGKNVFSDRSSQNVFFHHPTFSSLQLQKDKGTDYILSCKSKGLYNCTLFP